MLLVCWRDSTRPVVTALVPSRLFASRRAAESRTFSPFNGSHAPFVPWPDQAGRRDVVKRARRGRAIRNNGYPRSHDFHRPRIRGTFVGDDRAQPRRRRHRPRPRRGRAAAAVRCAVAGVGAGPAADRQTPRLRADGAHHRHRAQRDPAQLRPGVHAPVQGAARRIDRARRPGRFEGADRRPRPGAPARRAAGAHRRRDGAVAHPRLDPHPRGGAGAQARAARAAGRCRGAVESRPRPRRRRGAQRPRRGADRGVPRNAPRRHRRGHDRNGARTPPPHRRGPRR